MAKTPKDGGPAFPTLEEQYIEDPDGNYKCLGAVTGGMSLRDWFAGHALAGAMLVTAYAAARGQLTGNANADTVSQDAYAQADAMLAARTQEPK